MIVNIVINGFLSMWMKLVHNLEKKFKSHFFACHSPQSILVQSFQAKMGVNLEQIATDANSTKFLSSICPE